MTLVVCLDHDAHSWLPFLGDVKAITSRRGQSPHYAEVCARTPDMDEAYENPGNEDGVGQEDYSPMNVYSRSRTIRWLSRRGTMSPYVPCRHPMSCPNS